PLRTRIRSMRCLYGYRPDRRLAGVADLRPIGGLPWIACTEYAETLRAPVPLCVLLAAWAAEVLRRPPVMDRLARGRTPMAENLLRHWIATLKRHPSAILLGVQLLGVVLYPVMENTQAGRALFGAFGMVVLALALWVVNRSAMLNWVAWILALPAVVLSIVAAVS